MAKIAFSKLGLTKNVETKKIKWNDIDIEVKQYLPMSEKLDLIGKIVNLSIDEMGFYNPCRIHLFTTVEIVLAYAGITTTEKQKEDICKFYDLLTGSGFANEVFDEIPEDEIYFITNGVEKTVKSIYEYRNSVVGILDTVSKDYSNLNLEVEKIQDFLNNKQNFGVVKEVLDKLD